MIRIIHYKNISGHSDAFSQQSPISGALYMAGAVLVLWMKCEAVNEASPPIAKKRVRCPWWLSTCMDTVGGVGSLSVSTHPAWRCCPPDEAMATP